MARFQPPNTFDFSDPTGWPDWIERFAQYRLVVKLHRDDEDVQIATLLYTMGAQANVVFKQLVFDSADDSKKYEKVVEQFTKHFKPVSNVVHERAMFERAIQSPSESVDEYLRRLHRIADKCDFSAARDERIRDRFMANLVDTKLTLELQMLTQPDLAKAAAHARNYEQVRQQVAKQRQAPTEAKSPVAGGIQASRQKPIERAGQPKQSCQWCGAGSHGRTECPARGQKCSACGKTGHYKRVCRSAPAKLAAGQAAPGAHAVQSAQETHNVLFMGGVAEGSSATGGDPWHRSVSIGSTPVTFKIDTGADASVISADTYSTLHPQPPLTAATTALQGPDGHHLQLAGRFTVASRGHEGELFNHSVYVLQGHGANLLSRETSVRMGFVSPGVANVTTTPLPCMDGPPVSIRLRPDAKPYHCPVARRVPFPLLQKVKGELAKMVDSGIIKPVTEPTEWCAPMVAVRKKNGDVRVCVDLKRLNTSVQRETFVLPTVDETLAKLAGARYFSTLDTKKGFWQVPLDPASQPLTTFITPFGRYMFRRLPFGISSAPEIFQRRLMSILDRIGGVCVFMDDILIYASTQAEHDAILEQVRQALAAAHVTLNPDKNQLCQPSVKFLGHLLDANGVSPDPDRLAALAQLPAPTDVAGLRRVLGLFNYIGKFLPDLASISMPLRALLRHDTAWQWEPAQQSAFDALKSLAAQACTLAYFDPTKPLVVSADASSFGLGAALLQERDGDLLPVAYASKSLNDTQQRYAQIEKELLAVTWACDHFSQYLLGGQPFIVQTDHKPLLPLINSRDLDNVPLRCQRMLMRLLKFKVTAVYVPGPALVVADTLSRSPLKASDHSPAASELSSDIDVLVASVALDYASEGFHERAKQATADDPVLPRVAELILRGWPSRERDVPAELRQFYQVRTSLSAADGCLFFNTRLVIPAALQPEVLGHIHEGHQGVSKCRARARQAVWWPGMDKVIAQTVQDCTTCSKERLVPAAPLQPQPLPDRPWQRLACDLFQLDGDDYLLTVDYFSRFIEVDRLRTTTSNSVVAALSQHFSRHGKPEVLVSDNGPQFASHTFAVFLAKNGVEHRTSSPHYPQSNGMAERAVRTIKDLLKKTQDREEALLAYRSTPLQCGFSPAQLLMGRQIRSSLPLSASQLEPAWPDLALFRQQQAAAKDQQAADFDAHHAARPPQRLHIGNPVWIIDLGREGTVKDELTDRSYVVSSAGSDVRRNRKSLRPLPNHDTDQLPAVQPTTPADQPASPMPDDPPADQAAPTAQVPAADPPVNDAAGQDVVTTRAGRAVKPPPRLNL